MSRIGWSGLIRSGKGGLLGRAVLVGDGDRLAGDADDRVEDDEAGAVGEEAGDASPSARTSRRPSALPSTVEPVAVVDVVLLDDAVEFDEEAVRRLLAANAA